MDRKGWRTRGKRIVYLVMDDGLYPIQRYARIISTWPPVGYVVGCSRAKKFGGLDTLLLRGSGDTQRI